MVFVLNASAVFVKSGVGGGAFPYCLYCLRPAVLVRNKDIAGRNDLPTSLNILLVHTLLTPLAAFWIVINKNFYNVLVPRLQMIMDSYTHSSYTLIQATDLIRQGVKHVLAQGDGKVPEDLRKDLTEWQALGSASVGIPFELVRKLQRQLLETPICKCTTARAALR